MVSETRCQIAGHDQPFDAYAQRDCIIRFLRKVAGTRGRFVIGLSGGIDSDLVVRLACLAVAPADIRAFIVLDDGLDPLHVANARDVAKELGLALREIDFGGLSQTVLSRLSAAEPDDGFFQGSFLDLGKVKNSMRTAVLSMYVERSYIVLGTTNRTEFETGFFLPFGDGLGHVEPIRHLFKTEVRALAGVVGTRNAVLRAEPSAGYWIGETDIEDMAHWLYHGAPVQRELSLDENDRAQISAIQATLDFGRLDTALLLLSKGRTDSNISSETGLSDRIVKAIRTLTEAARRTKTRRLHETLARPDENGSTVATDVQT